MRKPIIFDAEPFCFGPISTTLNLVDYLKKKQTDLCKRHELILLGTGTSKQLAEATSLFDVIIECNTTSFESLNEHASLIKEAAVFVSTTNPHSINFLNQFKTKRIYIDTLFWLWGELRADFSQVTTYYIQRFFNIQKQLNKFSSNIPSYKVVNPLIAYDLKATSEEGEFTLINLGGIDTIYHKTSPFYNELIQRIFSSDHLKAHSIVVAGGGKTIENLRSRYQRENLKIDCFGKKEFKDLFTRCKKFITTPGLTSIHESHFLSKDVFFLPAQNYSQYLHMTYLRKHLEGVKGMHYDDIFRASTIPEALPEDDGIQLVKQLNEKWMNDEMGVNHLIQSIEEFLDAPKNPFSISQELSFHYSGVEDIGKDLATLCSEI